MSSLIIHYTPAFTLSHALEGLVYHAPDMGAQEVEDIVTGLLRCLPDPVAAHALWSEYREAYDAVYDLESGGDLSKYEEDAPSLGLSAATRRELLTVEWGQRRDAALSALVALDAPATAQRAA